MTRYARDLISACIERRHDVFHSSSGRQVGVLRDDVSLLMILADQSARG